MPIPKPDQRIFSDALSRMLAYACKGHIDQANEIVVELYRAYGDNGMWVLCNAVTELTIDMWQAPRNPEAFMHFAIVDAETGERVEPEDMDPDDTGYAVVWASRFMSASFNKDDATKRALFRAATRKQEDMTSLVSGVVLLAVNALTSDPDYPG